MHPHKPDVLQNIGSIFSKDWVCVLFPLVERILGLVIMGLVIKGVQNGEKEKYIEERTTQPPDPTDCFLCNWDHHYSQHGDFVGR